jgi:hypothetical protein
MTHEEAVEKRTAERYILGELAEPERDQFEEHFFECIDCADDIRTLSLLKEGTRAVGPASPVPARAAEQVRSWTEKWTLWWFRPGLAFATIGALAATASFTSWQNLQLRQQVGPQSVSSVMLRPETRGVASQVDVSQTGTFILLEADLPGASGRLTWQVQDTRDSHKVGEGSGAAPEAGASFKVLLPSSSMDAGTYRLTVRSSDGTKIWTFPFRSGRT